MSSRNIKLVRKAHVLSRKGTEYKINHYQVDPDFEIKGKPNFILAKDTKREGRPLVLLKRFNKQLKDKQYILRELEEREIDLASTLDHENIVRTIEVINDRQWANVFMVMEFMELGQIMKYDVSKKCYRSPEGKARMDSERIVSIMRDAVAGLTFMHDNQVVHRDIKPANILLTNNWTAKLVDFGVSEKVEIDDEGRGMIESGSGGSIIGTLWFLPLEAYKQNKYDGLAGDIYSLGITLFALVCGKLPLAIVNIQQFFDTLEKKGHKYPPSIKGGSFLGIKMSSTSQYYEVLQDMLNIHNPDARPKVKELMAYKVFS